MFSKRVFFTMNYFHNKIIFKRVNKFQYIYINERSLKKQKKIEFFKSKLLCCGTLVEICDGTLIKSPKERKRSKLFFSREEKLVMYYRNSFSSEEKTINFISLHFALCHNILKMKNI